MARHSKSFGARFHDLATSISRSILSAELALDFSRHGDVGRHRPRPPLPLAGGFPRMARFDRSRHDAGRPWHSGGSHVYVYRFHLLIASARRATRKRTADTADYRDSV